MQNKQRREPDLKIWFSSSFHSVLDNLKLFKEPGNIIRLLILVGVKSSQNRFLPVFRNGTPISAVCGDDVEELGHFGLFSCVEEDRLPLVVIGVDVVDLVYLFRQEARLLQCYVRFSHL